MREGAPRHAAGLSMAIGMCLRNCACLPKRKYVAEGGDAVWPSRLGIIMRHRRNCACRSARLTGVYERLIARRQLRRATASWRRESSLCENAIAFNALPAKTLKRLVCIEVSAASAPWRPATDGGDARRWPAGQ